MMKVRGEWGFSTAGRTLLCLTLTGVSGKTWLSCKTRKRRRLRGPQRRVVTDLVCQRDCTGYANQELAFQDGNVCVYLVECSCQENTNLLHPAGGGDGPAHDQNTRLAQVLKEQNKTQQNIVQGYLISNSIEPEFQTKRVSLARLHFQQPLSMRQ